jgi:hypothetical protein
MATAGLPLWSTTAASNATADPAVNWAEGMAPSAVNDSARAMMSSVARWRDDLYGITAGLSTGGTSTAFTVTTNATYASAAVMSGAIFTIIPHTTSGAAPTLVVDGLTARALNVATGVAVPTGALVSGTPYFVRYKHSSTEFIVIGPSIDVLASLDIIGGTQLTAPASNDTLPIYDLSATANRRILVSDFFKVVSDFTADTSPDSAADYISTYDASAAAAKKVLLSDLPGRLPRGYIDGCILSNGTDAVNDINIAAGVCRDSTNAINIDVPAITGKQLDANWAAGSAAGMRNSAAGIANTTYHIWAVRTAASATADVYAHTSTDAATVLTALQAESGGADYIYARRIGSILRESAAIVGFVQNGDIFHRKSVAADISAANPGTSAVTRTLSVPVGINVHARVYVGAVSGGGVPNVGILLSDLSETDEAAVAGSVSTFAVSGTSSAAGGPFEIRTNTSAQIRSRLSSSAADAALKIVTRGWRDARGKDS